MREVFRTTSLGEAQVLCSRLREHEIEPLLDGEHSGLTAVGLYTSAAPLRVLVPDEQEAAAREVLAARDVEVSPDLPALTAEEDARFEEALRRSRATSRRGVLAVLLLIVPAPTLILAAFMFIALGSLDTALYAALMGIATGVPALLLHFFARPASPLGGKGGIHPGPGPGPGLI